MCLSLKDKVTLVGFERPSINTSKAFHSAPQQPPPTFYQQNLQNRFLAEMCMCVCVCSPPGLWLTEVVGEGVENFLTLSSHTSLVCLSWLA